MVVTTLGQHNMLDFSHYSGPLVANSSRKSHKSEQPPEAGLSEMKKGRWDLLLALYSEAARKMIQAKILGSLWEATTQWIIIDTKWIKLN